MATAGRRSAVDRGRGVTVRPVSVGRGI
jgi:hypothetical protein